MDLYLNSNCVRFFLFHLYSINLILVFFLTQSIQPVLYFHIFYLAEAVNKV